MRFESNFQIFFHAVCTLSKADVGVGNEINNQADGKSAVLIEV